MLHVVAYAANHVLSAGVYLGVHVSALRLASGLVFRVQEPVLWIISVCWSLCWFGVESLMIGLVSVWSWLPDYNCMLLKKRIW